MARTALRHPVLALGLIAALGGGIAAPAATAASAPAQQTVQRGLLDDLLGGSVLAPVTDALLPSGDVDALVGALTAPVNEVLSVAQVTELLEVLTPEQLTQIADPATATSLLEGLLAALTALTAGDASPSLDDASVLIGQLTAILGAGLPGTDGEAVLIGVLNEVTALLGLPGVRELPVVRELVTVLEGAADGLPAPLQEPVQALLTAAVGTPTGTGTGTGTSSGAGAVTDPALAALLALLAGANAPPATAPAGTVSTAKPANTIAKRVVRARISSVKLSKNRKTLTIRVTCPAAAARCRIAPKATVAGKTLKLRGSKSLKRGRTASLKGRVPASTVRKLRAKGGKAVVRVSTAGSSSGAVKKTVKLRRAGR